MRTGVRLLVAIVLGALAGCGTGKAESAGPIGLEPGVEEPQGLEKEIVANDPRTRMRAALEKLGQGDEVPEGATLEEMQALLEEKVDRGIIPREHAQKVLKVLESADAHNRRLEQLDQQLFGENAY